MRLGKLDYETGKWVDEQPPIIPPSPVSAIPPLLPSPVVDQSTATPAPAPLSAADKARLIQQRQRGK